MDSATLHDKQHAIKRIEYVKNLYYTDQEYIRQLRKHMLKYKDNARGILNNRIPANQELMMFETYGFNNLKIYCLDLLNQNLEYCDVLESETHDKQIEKTIDYLEKSNSIDYLLTLKDFSVKNGKMWYIPVDRLINWIDSYMIQKEVFFKYGASEDALLFVPHYFTENVLLMCVYTDNEDMNFNNDMDAIKDTYDKLVKGISEILSNLPDDYMIDNLFSLSDEKQLENAQKISQLEDEFEEYLSSQ